MPAERRRSLQPKDRLSRFIHSMGESARLSHLAGRAGLTIERLIELRDYPQSPIKFLDALRLCIHSGGAISMADFDGRPVRDRDRYETPLGRKVAIALSDGTPLAEQLRRYGISHIEFKRWLEENIRWTDENRQRLVSAFSRNGVLITDEDFEEQVVDRLFARYKAARDELASRRARRLETAA